MKINLIGLMLLAFGSLNLKGAGNYMYIATNNSMYLYSGTIPATGIIPSWTKIDNPAGTSGAKSIGINAAGQMLCVGTDGAVYYSSGWNGTTANWIKQTAGSPAVKVSISGNIFAYRGSNNAPYYYSGAVPTSGQIPWTQVSGTVLDISVDSSGRMACIGLDSSIYYTTGVSGTNAGWGKYGGTASKINLAGSNLIFIGTNNALYFGGFTSAGITGWQSNWGVTNTFSDAALSSDSQLLAVNGGQLWYSPTPVNVGVSGANLVAWVTQTGISAIAVAIAAPITALTPVAPPDPTTTNKADFSTALAAATTPTLLKNLVNSGQSSLGTLFNTLTYLVDYPSTTNSVFTQLQSFFTNNVPNVTGTALTDLQLLLGGTTGSTTLNTYLNNFLTATEQATATTWLTAVNTAITAVNAQTTNNTDFTTALTSATTPTALKNLVNTGQSSLGTTFNTLTSLTDYPSTNNSVFTRIQSFFTNNVPNVTGTALTDLQLLLGGAASSTTLNTNLNNFLTSAEKTTATTLLTAVNTAITPPAVTPPAVTPPAVTPGAATPTDPTLAIKSAFAHALASATTPSQLNSVVNTPAYNSVTYLVDYPSTTNSIYTKINSFFQNTPYGSYTNATTKVSKSILLPTVTGTKLTDLQTLLKNANLAKFLTASEKTSLIILSLLTDLLIAYTEPTIANKTPTLSTRCNLLKTAIDAYKNKYTTTIPTVTSDYIFSAIMVPIFGKIISYGTPLKTTAQKNDRKAAVDLFTSALADCSFIDYPKTAAPAGLNYMKGR